MDTPRDRRPHHQQILVVDDDAIVRALVEAVFSTIGVVVRHAESGDEASRACRMRPAPAMAIVDVHLGDEDGIAVARYLCDKHPGLPVVSMSSREMDADQRRRLGGIRWFRKDGALVENLLAAFLEAAPQRAVESG
jgi:CheY-like chemotaxis protein